MTVELSGDLPRVLGLHNVALAAGTTVDALRARLRRDPELRALFTMVGTSFALPAAALPEIVARLKPEAEAAAE